MDRVSKLTDGCRIETATGLEFGPLANPLVRKDQGPVLYVDYADAESLREKSKNDPRVDATSIVDVDFNLEEGSLADLCSSRGPYAYALASHVFEHLPNPLGWLREVAALLEPGGIISLAVPDRRYTFDYFRSETTVPQLVAYDVEGLTRPSIVQLADHFYNARQVNTPEAWVETPRLATSPRYHDDAQVAFILQQVTEGRYVDGHCTVWTSEHFPETIQQAIGLRSIPLGIRRIHPPEPGSNEFIVQLERVASADEAAAGGQQPTADPA